MNELGLEARLRAQSATQPGYILLKKKRRKKVERSVGVTSSNQDKMILPQGATRLFVLTKFRVRRENESPTGKVWGGFESGVRMRARQGRGFMMMMLL